MRSGSTQHNSLPMWVQTPAGHFYFEETEDEETTGMPPQCTWKKQMRKKTKMKRQMRKKMKMKKQNEDEEAYEKEDEEAR